MAEIRIRDLVEDIEENELNPILENPSEDNYNNLMKLSTSLKASQNEIKLDKLTYFAHKSDLNGSILVKGVSISIEK